MGSSLYKLKLRPKVQPMKYILTDIEGTTTSISFVHETLFPFAKKNLKNFVFENLHDIDVQSALKQTQETSLKEDNKNLSNHEACNLLLHWIEIDRKHPALKNIQGLIWEKGYISGELKGHVYKDVPSALRSWKNAGIDLGVYSSGSVKAQHLLFKFSTEGNLLPYFKNHFDTAVGQKKDPVSYSNIAKSLNLEPSDILFLSDIKEELDAAQLTKMKTIQLVRQRDVVIGIHETITSFDEIKF